MQDDPRDAGELAEQRMLPAVRATLAAYLRTTGDAILRGDTRRVHAALTRTAAVGDVDPAELPPSMAAWPPPAVWTAAALDHILPAATGAWVAGWTATLTPEQADTLNHAAALQEHLAETTARLTAAEWPDEVYEAVQRAVAASIAAGEPIGDLRARVAAVLEVDRWSRQAEVIARNEALTAYNGGAYRAGVARTEQLGEQLHKRWLATRDPRTRPTHRRANGQIAAADTPFDVGGSTLRYPHDPLGPAEETAQCRCVVQWIDPDQVDQARADYAQHLARLDTEAGPPVPEPITAAPSPPGGTPMTAPTPTTVPANLADDPWSLPTDGDLADAAWTAVDGDQPEPTAAGGDPVVVAGADFTPSGGPTAAKRQRAEQNGHALPGGRYPIENGSDLSKAIDSVGRAKGGDAGRRVVRRHIMRQAKRLGLSDRIPATWNTDGSLKPEGGATARPRAAAATLGLRAAPDMPWYEWVAELVPMEPDTAAFRTPPMQRGTKMHVLNDAGWVGGYIADWDSRHRVYDVQPPRDPYGGSYPKMHRHPVRTADGGQVMTGPIGTNGHGDTETTDLWQVMAHYDDPRYVVANVRVTENEYGIWAAGALRAGVTPFQIMLLDTYSQSGHWMPGQTGYPDELVASACVSVPAFELSQDPLVYALAAAAGPERPKLANPTDCGRVDDAGRPVVLVAAGIVAPPAPATPGGPDPFAFYRAVRRAERVDGEITAACRRVRTVPGVDDAAARMREGA